MVVHLSREDYQGAVQNLPLFEQAGFLVEEFGDGDLIVREVPVMLLGAEVKEIIEQTAHDLSQNKKDTTPHALDDLLHSVACKSAVRANDKNTLDRVGDCAAAALGQRGKILPARPPDRAHFYPL